MNKERLLIITSEFPPQPGGIGNHAFNLAKQLQLQGCNVTALVDMRSKNGFEEQQFDATLPFKVVRIKRYRIILFTYLKRIFTYRSLVTKSAMILATGKFPLWMVGLSVAFAVFIGKEAFGGTGMNILAETAFK